MHLLPLRCHNPLRLASYDTWYICSSPVRLAGYTAALPPHLQQAAVSAPAGGCYLDCKRLNCYHAGH